MYDASYVRLRNASIAYRVPMSKGNITLRGAANNLFVLTNFIGLDPELTRDFETAKTETSLEAPITSLHRKNVLSFLLSTPTF